jgi:glycosyltransferase involved in cell wall biosynthesis
VERLSRRKGVKVNLIQDYETWTGHVESVHRSYDLKDVHNIVISSWLYSKVSKFTQKALFILFNGIDIEKFRITVPIEHRNPNVVCMLYHTEERKGTKYGLEALKEIKKKQPAVEAILFSVFEKPPHLPEWISYHQKPKSLADLYNRSAIFITNSLQEGWGLPSIEAMCCGCALVATNIEGHADYANKETSILVEARNVNQMASAVISLLQDNERRVKLAKAGNQYVQKYSWTQSALQMEDYLSNLIIHPSR